MTLLPSVRPLFLLWIVATCLHGLIFPSQCPAQDCPMENAARDAMRATLLHEPDTIDRAMETVASQKDMPRAEEIARLLGLLNQWSALDLAERADLAVRRVPRGDPPAVRRALLWEKKTNPLHQIPQSQRIDWYNNATGVFNYFAELIGSLLTLDTQVLTRLGVDFVFLWEPWVTLSAHDRQALALYDRHRDDPDARGWDFRSEARRLEQIRRQLQRKNAADYTTAGRWHLRRGEYEQARQAFLRAEALGHPGARDPRRQSVSLLGQEHRRRLRATEIEPSPIDPRSNEAIRPLLLALAAASRDEIRGATADFREAHPDSMHYSDAAYAELVTGNPTSTDSETRRRLESREMRTSSGGLRWRTARESPQNNPLGAVDRAAAQYRGDVRRYILSGRRNESEFPVVYESRSQKVHQTVSTFGLILPLDWIRRSLTCVFGTPVDNREWRESAVRALRQMAETDDPRFQDLAGRLAESYEERGRLNEARDWHRAAFGTDDEYEARLDEKGAAQVRRHAMAQEDPALRNALLEDAIRRFPDTQSAERARKTLRKSALDEDSSERIPKADLARWSGLWLDRGFSLEPEWFDGDIANGELHARGITLHAGDPGRITFTLMRADGPEEQSRTLESAALAELEPALRAWRRETAAGRAFAHENILPIAIEGSAGPGGFSLFPRLTPIAFDQASLPLYRSPYATE